MQSGNSDHDCRSGKQERVGISRPEFLLYLLVFVTNSAFADPLFLPHVPFAGGTLFLSDVFVLAACVAVWFRSDMRRMPHRGIAWLLASSIIFSLFLGLSRGGELHYVLREIHAWPYYALTALLCAAVDWQDIRERRLFMILAATTLVSILGVVLQLVLGQEYQFMTYSSQAFDLSGKELGALRVRPPSQWLFVTFPVLCVATGPLWHQRRKAVIGILMLLAPTLLIGMSRVYLLALSAGIITALSLTQSSARQFVRRMIVITAGCAVTLTAVSLTVHNAFSGQNAIYQYWTSFEARVVGSFVPSAMDDPDAIYTFGSRLYELQEGAAEILAHPIVGLGLGVPYRDILPFEWSQGEVRDDPDGAVIYMHDFYVYVIMRYGVIGALLFFLLIRAYWRDAVGFMRASDPACRRSGAAVIAVFVALLAGNLVSPSFTDGAPAAVLVGILAGYVARKSMTQSSLSLATAAA